MNCNKTKNKDEWRIELEKLEPSLWAQLSGDLVGEITSRLDILSDQVRFRAVCKNWLHVFDQYNNNNIVSIPWLINIKSSDHVIECRLYEPTRPLPFHFMSFASVYKINLHDFVIFPRYKKPCRIDTGSSKNGWIFSSITNGDCDCTWFLLFTPFSRKEISLPSLAHSYSEQPIKVKTFTTKPDSPDCVFLVLCRNNYKYTITINIFRHGYKEWEVKEFGDEGLIFFSMPVYIEGTFYFVSPGGKLASYNVARGAWKTELVENTFPNHMKIYKAFELNRELMFIGMGNDSGFIIMFDWATNAWVPLKSLRDHSIFISYNSIWVQKIEKDGKSNCGLLPNTIYYGSESNRVYSLDNGILVKFSKDSEITKGARVCNCHGHWFEPPHDILRKDPRNSLGKRRKRRNSLGKLELEDLELEDLLVLDQMRRLRIDPRDNGTSSIKQYDMIKRGKQRKKM